MRVLFRSALGALLLASAAAAAEVIEPSDDALALLREAVANSRARLQPDPERPLEFLQRVESDNGKVLRRQLRRVDERLPPAERVVLVSIDDQPPDAEQLETFHKQRQRDREQRGSDKDRRVSISFEEFDLSGARLLTERDGRPVYEVPNAVRSMIGESNAAMAEHLRMEVEVEPDSQHGPYLTRLLLESTQAFKPGLIGKVQQFRMQTALLLHDSGRLVFDRMDVDVEARAMFNDIERRERVVFSDYRVHPSTGGVSAD
jgi:hypothetical protein